LFFATQVGAVAGVALVGSSKSAGPQPCHAGTVGLDNGSRTSCTAAQYERGPGDGDRRYHKVSAIRVGARCGNSRARNVLGQAMLI
jgi:hypothetical protein